MAGNITFGKATGAQKMDAGQTKQLKFWDSISSLGTSRVNALENRTKAREEVFKGDEGKKVVADTYDYIFGGDPDAVSPLDEINAEYNTKIKHIDDRVQYLAESYHQ